MCGGGGKSAESYYQDIKPEPVQLQSLSMGTRSMRKPTYGNVRTGQARRSLINPFMVMGKDNGN